MAAVVINEVSLFKRNSLCECKIDENCFAVFLLELINIYIGLPFMF